MSISPTGLIKISMKQERLSADIWKDLTIMVDPPTDSQEREIEFSFELIKLDKDELWIQLNFASAQEVSNSLTDPRTIRIQFPGV